MFDLKANLMEYDKSMTFKFHCTVHLPDIFLSGIWMFLYIKYIMYIHQKGAAEVSAFSSKTVVMD